MRLRYKIPKLNINNLNSSGVVVWLEHGIPSMGSCFKLVWHQCVTLFQKFKVFRKWNVVSRNTWPGAGLWGLYPSLIPGRHLCFLIYSDGRILHHTLLSPAAPAMPSVPWWMKTSWQWPKISPSFSGCLCGVFSHNIKVTDMPGLSKELKICLVLKNQSVGVIRLVRRMTDE